MASWLFHIPNFVLAAVMYTIIGRLVLGLMAPPNWQNFIWLAFIRLTDPFINAVRAITPKIVPDPFMPLATILWCMILRIVLFVLAGYGLLS